MRELAQAQPVITLFILLAVGCLLGRIPFGGIRFGSVVGVMFAGLLFAPLEITLSPGAQAVGFALFMFAVGYQAGPRFLEMMRTDGLRYFLLAMVVAAAGTAATALATAVVKLPPGGAAGLLGGALTSTPLLAAAQEAVRSGTVPVPAGVSVEAMVSNMAACYAIAYLFGTVGLVVGIRLLPKLLGTDLAAEARAMEQADPAATPASFHVRAYRVTNERFCQQPIRELRETYWDGLSVVRLRRGDEWVRPPLDDTLKPGDELYAYGHFGLFARGLAVAGEEIPVDASAYPQVDAAQVVVAKKGAIGRNLESLDLPGGLGVVIAGVRRGGLTIPVTSDTRLRWGDIVDVVGPANSLEALRGILGPMESDTVGTDFVALSLGIAAGLLLGLASVTVGGIPLGLGSAGGLLLSGLAVGQLNSLRPTVGRFPEASSKALMDFGLLIFMASIGLKAGTGIIDVLRESGLAVFLSGVAVTLAPLLVGFLFGHRVLRLNPVILMGALTGAMTSAPALSVVTEESRSGLPGVGYAGSYAFANILLPLAGTLILFL